MSERDDTGAQRLGQHDRIADLGAGVADESVFGAGADDGETAFDFRIVNAVPADYRHARFPHLFDPATQNFAHGAGGQKVNRKANDRQRHLRHTAHRVDVTQGTGGGDLSEGEWVIDRRAEQIDRKDRRRVRRQHHHPRVIAIGGSHHYAGVGNLRQAAQHFLKDSLADLRGRTSVADVFGQPHRRFPRRNSLARAEANPMQLESVAWAKLFHVADAVPQCHRALHNATTFVQLRAWHRIPRFTHLYSALGQGQDKSTSRSSLLTGW